MTFGLVKSETSSKKRKGPEKIRIAKVKPKNEKERKDFEERARLKAEMVAEIEEMKAMTPAARRKARQEKLNQMT